MACVVRLLIAAAFLVAGIVYSSGKGSGTGIIAGYRRLSPEEQARYDESALGKFLGKLMFAFAGCWLVMAFSAVLGWVLYPVGMVLLLAIALGGIIYANIGGRFQTTG